MTGVSVRQTVQLSREGRPHWVWWADGAAFGPEPTLVQSAYFRYHNRCAIRGLYFVGAGTHPGAGVPGVLNSANFPRLSVITLALGVVEHRQRLLCANEREVATRDNAFDSVCRISSGTEYA